MIIAVDGPSAAGKGTLARRLAAALGLAYLDTGSLYRATALRVLRQGGDYRNPNQAATAARAITAADLDDAGLRDEAVGEAASSVAAIPDVRQALLTYQRRFAHHPPGGAAGAVLDGRDIGTVVCPEADVKLFVTAATETRARRRFDELVNHARTVDLAEVRADMARRDRRDSRRGTAPLVPAADAHLLDTTNLDIEAAFRAAKRIVVECT